MASSPDSSSSPIAIYGATMTTTFKTSYTAAIHQQSYTIGFPDPPVVGPLQYTTLPGTAGSTLPILVLTNVVGIAFDSYGKPVKTATLIQDPPSQQTTTEISTYTKDGGVWTTLSTQSLISQPTVTVVTFSTLDTPPTTVTDTQIATMTVVSTPSGDTTNNTHGCSSWDCWIPAQQAGTLVAVVVAFIAIILGFCWGMGLLPDCGKKVKRQSTADGDNRRWTRRPHNSTPVSNSNDDILNDDDLRVSGIHAMPPMEPMNVPAYRVDQYPRQSKMYRASPPPRRPPPPPPLEEPRIPTPDGVSARDWAYRRPAAASRSRRARRDQEPPRRPSVRFQVPSSDQTASSRQSNARVEGENMMNNRRRSRDESRYSRRRDGYTSARGRSPRENERSNYQIRKNRGAHR